MRHLGVPGSLQDDLSRHLGVTLATCNLTFHPLRVSQQLARGFFKPLWCRSSSLQDELSSHLGVILATFESSWFHPSSMRRELVSRRLVTP